MNIFWLHINTLICAQYHCDKHVVKMILEYAQLLSCAHHVLDREDTIYKNELYKMTHVNHPCAIWVRQSKANYEWLYKLFYNLCKEYTHRYTKIHKTETKLLHILENCPKNIPETEHMTDAPVAITNHDIHVYNKGELDLIESYRNYYILEKKGFARWTNRHVPHWFTIGINK